MASSGEDGRTDRRRFLRGVVGGAVLGAAGTAGGAMVVTSTSSENVTGGPTRYVGIENVDGPPRRGLPQVPLEVDDEGYLRGIWPEVTKRWSHGARRQVAETDLGGVTYSSRWFQYCGLEASPAIRPTADRDPYLRSVGRAAAYEWQESQEKGRKLHVDDFSDYETWGNGIGTSGLGKPALATWRSTDLPPHSSVLVTVLRSERIEALRDDHPLEAWLRASTERGFVAWVSNCIFHCCITGFKAHADSETFDAGDRVYCPCHQSVYDPFSIVGQSFVARSRATPE